MSVQPKLGSQQGQKEIRMVLPDIILTVQLYNTNSYCIEKDFSTVLIDWLIFLNDMKSGMKF